MTDGEHLQRYLGGDVEAFDGIVERHQAGLLRFAERLTGCPESAQDLVQETFLRLVREARTLEGADGLACWLFRVCRNLCTDQGRKETRMRRRHQQVAVRDEVEPAPAPFEAREERHQVRRLLAALPADERAVLLLKVQEGRSYREIARITGLSLHHVGTAVHRGLRRVAGSLRQAGLA